MRRTLRLTVALLTALALAAGTPAAANPAQPQWKSLAYMSAPADNPLKGFMPFAGDYQTFPHSMEWFYLPLRDVMTGPRQFRWDAFEAQLAAVAGRGHQAVFRFYLDYPGKPTGIPQYLLDDGLVTRRTPTSATTASASPLTTTTPPRRRPGAVHHRPRPPLRRRPRIGFITLGLIGFWGEWHTWPYDGWTQPKNWMPDTDVLARILTRYADAFDTTRLLARYPSPQNKHLNLGYHDDSFAFETLPPTSWHFVQRLIDEGVTDKWRTQPASRCGSPTPPRTPAPAGSPSAPSPPADLLVHRHRPDREHRLHLRGQARGSAVVGRGAGAAV